MVSGQKATVPTGAESYRRIGVSAYRRIGVSASERVGDIHPPQ
jgi:hypothetical protein